MGGLISLFSTLSKIRRMHEVKAIGRVFLGLGMAVLLRNTSEITLLAIPGSAGVIGINLPHARSLAEVEKHHLSSTLDKGVLGIYNYSERS